jgi:hypothetical protein
MNQHPSLAVSAHHFELAKISEASSVRNYIKNEAFEGVWSGAIS